jgi:transglutaminase-like putative cysteine protease
MKKIIHESAPNLYVRKWAEKLVSGIQPRDERGEAEAIFDFVQRSLRYARDPRGTEFVQTPLLLLTEIEQGKTPSADCDDYTTLGLSLLRALGFPVVIRVTGYRPDGTFSHVYGMVNINGVWTAFDAVRRDKDLGWEAPNKARRMDVKV